MFVILRDTGLQISFLCNVFCFDISRSAPKVCGIPGKYFLPGLCLYKQFDSTCTVKSTGLYGIWRRNKRGIYAFVYYLIGAQEVSLKSPCLPI